MKVEVKLYATLRKYYPPPTPWKPLSFEVAKGTTLTRLLEQLGIPEGEAKVVFVNNVKRDLSYTLRSGDKVGILPPIAGG